MVHDLLALLLEQFDGLLDFSLLVVHVSAEQVNLADLILFRLLQISLHEQ